MTNRLRQLLAKTRAWSLSTYIFITVATTTAICSGFVGYYSLETMYQNQLRDFWAIMHLELEVRIREIESTIAEQPWTSSRHSISNLKKIPPPIVYKRTKGSLIPYRGASKTLKISELSNRLANKDVEVTVVQYAGKPYIIRQLSRQDVQGIFNERVPAGEYYAFWDFSLKQWLKVPSGIPEETLIYVSNRRGQLLFASNPNINADNFVERDLSQRFIKSPLSAGQLEFSNSGGDAIYGFYREVDSTNLVVFAEVTKNSALRAVRDLVYKTSLIGIAAIALAVILLHFPLNAMLGPVRELAALSGRIAKGEFGLSPKAQAFGEIKVLTDAFSNMSSNLLARDQAITKLLEEQKQKFRLEAELRVASAIQNNLLPHEKLSPDSQLQVADEYMPASECAGDWYTFYYDPTHREAIFCITDVCGHGTGSSIFTAAVAGVFEHYKLKSCHFESELFLKDAHRVIQRFGDEKWHATMLIGRFSLDSGELELVNAGHTPLLHLDPSKDKGRFISIPSSPIGMSGEASYAKQTIAFESGSQLVLYTDGLIEATTLKGKPYGMKRLRKAAQGNTAVEATLSAIKNDLNSQISKGQKEDDICILVVQAA